MVLIECRASYVIPIGSIIFLFIRKPNCSGEMCLSREGFNLRAMTFEIRLYATLRKAMGLKSAKEEGFSNLGIKVRNVAFTEGATIPETLECSTAAKRSSFAESKKLK